MSRNESIVEAAPLVWFEELFKKVFADSRLQAVSVIRNFRITAANDKAVSRGGAIIEGELAQDSVVKDFFTTAADGKNSATKFYNLYAISVQKPKKPKAPRK